MGICTSLVSAGNSYHFAIVADQGAFEESVDGRDFMETMINHVDTLASAAGIYEQENDHATEFVDLKEGLWSPSLRSSGEPHGQKVGSKVTADPLLFETRYLLNHFT
ncbi:unnamed protein product [Darwinula stevensoni]|uniref:Uncharacterized protein n=1 Tax=Darwinula stevensoni TaxID=69355 RepID=A0A7R8XK03_9CRUS|nr:unnamed protein product [Darwinula stevensoni]CAG0892700.1 unnamed protein product [Darwinula stevensoni]